jgi:hypothetical protein
MRLKRVFPNGVLHTPTRFTAGATAAAWWLIQPALVSRYYSEQLAQGAYRPNADSISIPIGTDWALWFIASPVVLLLVWWALRRYLDGVPCGKKPSGARSIILTVVALLMAATVIIFAWSDLQDGYPVLAAAQLPAVIVLLWLRAGNATNAWLRVPYRCSRCRDSWKIGFSVRWLLIPMKYRTTIV